MVTKIREEYLQPVAEEKVFWCSDGKVIASMEELHFALKEMSEDTYRYHANAEKNDFSRWVREVIGDETLAKNLDKVIKQSEAANKVSTRVKSLKTKKK